MTLKDYQSKAMTFSLLPDTDLVAVQEALCGLIEEVGEVAGEFKRAYRGDSLLDTEAVKKELGDALWYLTALATRMGYNLEDIAAINLFKLQSRKDRDLLKGSGGDR